MTDEVKCLKENLQHKREEIDEKTQLLESTQEKLMEANGLVNMLSSAPDQNSGKHYIYSNRIGIANGSLYILI